MRRQLITVLNRLRGIDSKLSLDGPPAKSDYKSMIVQPYQLYIERTDAAKNMARYYAMRISPTLFGDACLTRTWGRIGKNGQTIVQHFAREEDAVDMFLTLTRQKRTKGYSPRARSLSSKK